MPVLEGTRKLLPQSNAFFSCPYPHAPFPQEACKVYKTLYPLSTIRFLERAVKSGT